jgi:hypothetical protein
MKSKTSEEKEGILKDEPLGGLFKYGLDDIVAIPGDENMAPLPIPAGEKGGIPPLRYAFLDPYSDASKKIGYEK